MSTQLDSEDPQGNDPRDDPRDHQRDARERVKAAFLRPSKRQLVIAVALGALGFAGVTQVRVSSNDDSYATMRQADLIQTLNGLSAASRRAEQDLNDLEKTRDQLRSSTEGRQAAMDQARKEADQVAVLAGTVPAKGPGIEVTIDDPDAKLTANLILDAVQELRDAGAEAMEFNNRIRITATSYVLADESGLRVDGIRLSRPYVLEAIGDPETLAGGLGVEGGFVDDAHKADSAIEVRIVESKSMRIDAVVGQTTPTYAKPSGTG